MSAAASGDGSDTAKIAKRTRNRMNGPQSFYIDQSIQPSHIIEPGIIQIETAMSKATLLSRLAPFAVLALLFLPADRLWADRANIGEVTRTQANVTGELAGQRRDLQKALPVFSEEVVTTGSLARAGVRFKDGSQLTMGAQARVVLDRFVFDASGGGAISLLKGAMRFTSGIAAKKDFRIVTPVAVIGIRGTDFWVGQIDGAYGVLLLKGEVEVTNDGGSVTLDEPLQGTLIFSQNAAPEDPSLWPGERRARALAGISFN